MGAAKGNPLSPQFKIDNLAGDIPPVHFDATVQVEIVPSAAWLESNPPDEEGNRPACPAAEAELRFVLCAQAIFPSRVVVPVRWPRGEAPVGEILREPLPRVLALMVQQNPQLKDPVKALLAADEPKTPIEGA